MLQLTIIPKTSQAIGPWPAQVIAAALSGLVMAGGAPAANILAYQRSAIASGALWRLWTGNFVHLGFWHYALNAATLAAFAVLCPEPHSVRDWCLRWVVLCAAVGIGLFVFTPSLQRYVGLSGVTYGFLYLGLGAQARQGSRLAMACLAFLSVRIAIEFLPGTMVTEERIIGGSVVPASHLCGIAGAALYALGGWLLAYYDKTGRTSAAGRR